MEYLKHKMLKEYLIHKYNLNLAISEINISYKNDDVICLTVKSDGKITQETLDGICGLIVESLEIVKI